MLGAWPWPGDDVEDGALDDPVATAKGYAASRILGLGATTASAYREGDANSGEVVFTGHFETTVGVRRYGDGWKVEFAITDLLDGEGQGDGTVLVTASDAGRLTHRYRTPGDDRVQETQDVPAGGDMEITATGDKPSSHILTLETAEGVIGLYEFLAIDDTFDESAVPADAIAPWAIGDDPIEVAV